MKKLITLTFILAAMLSLSTGSVFAQETTPITGTVDSIEYVTDTATGETVVTVTLVDESGATQTVNLSLETAEALGLVSVDDTTGEITVNEVTDPITIDPADILPGEDEEGEEKEHPVGSALGDFFGEMFGVDYDSIMTAHEDGFGFGVIAQALWLTKQIEGDADTFNALLEAKQSGDYSNITLADGSTPDNWGDVVKSLKKGENLGSVMSGRANASDDGTGPGNGNGNGQGNGNNGQGQGNGQGNGKGKGNDNGGGNGKGNGNGKGKP